MREVRRLVVIGTGLIGGSVAAAARSAGFAERVVGVDADPTALEEGQIGRASCRERVFPVV